MGEYLREYLEGLRVSSVLPDVVITGEVAVCDAGTDKYDFLDSASLDEWEEGVDLWHLAMIMQVFG